MKTIAVLVAGLLVLLPASVFGQLDDEKREAAEALLTKNGISAGETFRVTRYIAYRRGGGVVQGLQVHDGLPVFDGETTYHFGPDDVIVSMPSGAAYSMGGSKDLSDLVIDRDDLISRDAAWASIEEQDRSDAESPAATVHACEQRSKTEAELGILEHKPVWRFKCTYMPLPVLYVDATGGSYIEYAPPAIAPMTLPGQKNPGR